jgi:hypothetical protein
MARTRFQKGHVRVRKTKNPYWEGFYWEDLRLEDGMVVRKQRAINLGRTEDLPTKKLAERKLADKLAGVNDVDYKPRPILTVGDFVTERYRKLILPLRKRSTRHGYETILDRHILPEFKNRQLVEVSHEDLQGFANRKTASGARGTPSRTSLPFLALSTPLPSSTAMFAPIPSTVSNYPVNQSGSNPSCRPTKNSKHYRPH